MIGISDSNVPFISTNGAIGNYRTVLDILFLNGISRALHIPRPSDNRLKECIFRSRIAYDEYRWMNYRSSSLHFGGFVEDVYLRPLHSCFFVDLGVHYPSGCFLEAPHWRELFGVCKQRDSLLWLNMGWGGLGNHSFKEDIQPIQECIEMGIPAILSIDFTNSLGLHGDGFGCIMALNEKVQLNGLLSGMQSSMQNVAMYFELFSNQDSERKWYVL